MQKSDGINYAPVSKVFVEPAAAPGEFCFSVIGIRHGHIYGMCNGLLEAGATLRQVYDEDEELLAAFLTAFPQARRAGDEEEILNDAAVQLVASSAIPCRRAEIGIRAIKKGKHYFSDKPGMTTVEQLEAVKATVQTCGKKYYIYFSERIHVESAVFAGQLIAEGKLGRVLHVDIMAPHRLNKPVRPDWFFDRAQNGSILNDIGSHQFEQFLTYTGAKTAKVIQSRERNYANQDKADFRDFGDALLEADNGATGYVRVDWFTPEGLSAWGDGRVFIIGEKGTIEIRKYVDLGVSGEGDHVFFTDAGGEHRYSVSGKVGFPFFREFIKDCMNDTENSMRQELVFETMRIALECGGV